MKDGKLFGKFNIVDLLVILLLIAAVIFLGMRVIRLNSDPNPAGSNSRIRYTVKFSSVDPEVYENAKAHIDGGETQLVAGESFIDGQVVEFWSEPNQLLGELGDGTYVQAQDPYFLTVYATVEAGLTGTLNNQVVSQEIRIGRTNSLKTLSVELFGTIIDMEYLN